MNKTALITGASSGIGMELATVFAKQKENLVLVARNAAKLEEMAKELTSKHGIKVNVLAIDLSELNSAQKVYMTIAKKTICHIDYLINNAGFGDFGLFAESKWEKQFQMINLNITTLTHLTHLFLPTMIKNNYGKIMNVASTAAFQPGPTMSVYYATKAFVLHFSEAIANELEGSGVTVTALCPGATESGFQSAAAMEESKLVKGKKLPTSSEVAEYGYKAMMKGEKVAIHGMMNYLMANSVRFSPRAMVLKMVRMMQDK
jgi:short-subunit dehydrogenase